MPDAADRLWIAIGDIHERAENLAKIPELDQAAGVIITGDLTNCGDAAKAEKIINIIKQKNLPALAQIGNMDLPEVNDWLEESGQNLHARAHALTPDIAIFGIGGSNITPMNTPSEFSEEMYSRWLGALDAETAGFPRRMLISHAPPKDTICDDIGGGVHVGSTAVREFIEARQPDICLCGHIHEGRGTDRIGKTLVINPGPLADGGYVIIRETSGALTAELARIPA